jgi:F-type H+-transporting ATPase subunit b
MSKGLHLSYAVALRIALVLIAAVVLASGNGLYGAWPGPSSPPLERAALFVIAAPLQEEASSSEPERPGEAEAESAEKEPSAAEEVYHWLNFLIVAGGLGYLFKKLFVPFLQERRQLIREDMDRSARVLAEADQRLQVVEGKLHKLDEELASLRQAAFRESVAERERIEQAAQAEAKKIVAATEQEIESAIKAARQQLKRYATELAVGVAEKKIRAALTPQSEQRLLQSFVKDLTDGSTEKKN